MGAKKKERKKERKKEEEEEEGKLTCRILFNQIVVHCDLRFRSLCMNILDMWPNVNILFGELFYGLGKYTRT
jgi:hypothetical protein